MMTDIDQPTVDSPEVQAALREAILTGKFDAGPLPLVYVDQDEHVALHESIASIARFTGLNGQALDEAISGAVLAIAVQLQRQRARDHLRRDNIGAVPG
jgi:hypothetical protein